MGGDFEWKEAKTCAHDYLLKAITKALRDLGVPKSARILDAGSGGGYTVNELYKEGFTNIWGFDLSESGIRIAKESFPEVGERFEVHDAYEEKLPDSFIQGDYDLVLSAEVIEHLYDPRRYIKNITLWLKSGGILILTTPYHGYLKNLAIALGGGFDKHFDSLKDGGHIKFWSKGTLYRLLSEAGITPFGFRGSGRLPLLWKSMVITGTNG